MAHQLSKEEENVTNVNDVDLNCSMLRVKCNISGHNESVKFLVDSGAGFSCVPVSLAQGLRIPIEDCNIQLLSCDGSPVSVLGTIRLRIIITQLRREFSWNFVVANLTQAILGWDFLNHFSLSLDCGSGVIRDSSTGLVCSVSRALEQQSLALIFDKIPSSVRDVLEKYPELIQPTSNLQFISTGVEHHIRLQESVSPPWSKPRRLTGLKLQAARDEINKLLEVGIIRPSTSQFASPIHMAPKGEGFRLTGDFRNLNSITIPDRYPLPHLHDFSDKLSGSKIFSKIDLFRAYHQLPVASEDVPKTAITTPFGSFEYITMPFGLRNSAATFQRFMNDKFNLFSDFSFVYVDDILVFSQSEEEHLEHLNTIFKTLHVNNLKISSQKCIFQVPELDFLGYRISADGIKPIPSRIEQFANTPLPKDYATLRSYIGALGFYRRMIPNYANEISLLQGMLHSQEKSKNLNWTDEAVSQFNKSRTLLESAVTLSHPTSSSLFHLVTDASSYAVGTALHQVVDGQPKHLRFFSKKLSNSQKAYSTFDRELLAAYLAVLHFKKFIDGQTVLLFTDHKPLVVALVNSKEAKLDRQQRHMAVITEFISEYHHIKGKDNIVADFLSRHTEEAAAETTTSISNIENTTDLACDLPAIAAAQVSDAECQEFKPKLTSFKLPNETQLYCDTSTLNPRPFVPTKLRANLFKELHGLYHPGIRSSVQLISERYYWPGMRKEIKELAKQCLSCQQNKILTHTKSPIKEFQLPTTSRFQFVHCDIVGPLPVAVEHGVVYRYLLTIIDRTTRWPEACPLVNIDAVSVAKAFVKTWISRWGTPLYLCTDQGCQFESEFFTELSSLIGFHRVRSTAYHPQTNGMIERFHRTIKAALRSRKEDWFNALPAVLLGLRSHPHCDTGVSPFEMVTGATLFVPPVSVVPSESIKK